MEKLVVSKNENGKQLVGILHLPEGKRRPPLVIICHGFGATKTSLKFIRLARFLEKNKIASFRFDFEGCGDSEGNLEEATIKKEVSDLKSVFRNILKKQNIKPKSIAFIGHSIGALICSLFMVQNKIQAKTIVMWSPAFNQKELMGYWVPSKKEIENWERKGYLYREGKEKIIGINYLKENKDRDYSSILTKIRIPILILHGQKDDVVPVKFSKRLIKDYKNTKLEIIPKADHNFEDYYLQEKLIRETVKWLKRHLLK